MLSAGEGTQFRQAAGFDGSNAREAIRLPRKKLDPRVCGAPGAQSPDVRLIGWGAPGGSRPRLKRPSRFAVWDHMLNWLKRHTLQDQIDRELRTLTRGDRASLPVLDSFKYSYRAVRGERLICVHDDVIRIECRSTGRYGYTGASLSVPVGGGVRIRVGTGQIAARRNWHEVAQGRLLVTDKALAFESGSQNQRWTWNQIANVEICTDGYAIFRRHGKPVLLVWRESRPRVCAIIDLLLRRIG